MGSPLRAQPQELVLEGVAGSVFSGVAKDDRCLYHSLSAARRSASVSRVIARSSPAQKVRQEGALGQLAIRALEEGGSAVDWRMKSEQVFSLLRLTH